MLHSSGSYTRGNMVPQHNTCERIAKAQGEIPSRITTTWTNYENLINKNIKYEQRQKIIKKKNGLTHTIGIWYLRVCCLVFMQLAPVSDSQHLFFLAPNLKLFLHANLLYQSAFSFILRNICNTISRKSKYLPTVTNCCTLFFYILIHNITWLTTKNIHVEQWTAFTSFTDFTDYLQNWIGELD